MYIEKFLPEKPTLLKYFDYNYINTYFDKTMYYAPKGRYSIERILNSLRAYGNKVLIPVYACSSIKTAIINSGFIPVFCDIDERDLNISVSSVYDCLCNCNSIVALIVPSLYGNPANLVELSLLCSQFKVFMIDDAAQAFGAVLNNKPIGSYGDAGFFSFSPGKPMTAPIGSFFWCSTPPLTNKNSHGLNLIFFHYILYWDFYFNRLNIYKYKKYCIFKLLSYLSSVVLKMVDLKYDKLFRFEELYLGGILNDYLNSKYEYRKVYINRFQKEFQFNNKFRVIQCIRGVPSNTKFVLLATDSSIANEIVQYLSINDVYCSRGYQLLDEASSYPVASKISTRIIEIPIENNEDKMNYLFLILHKFLGDI